ncbi:MAG: hypothetical protein ACRDJJ_03790 [Actinomycetota bacterium]
MKTFAHPPGYLWRIVVGYATFLIIVALLVGVAGATGGTWPALGIGVVGVSFLVATGTSALSVAERVMMSRTGIKVSRYFRREILVSWGAVEEIQEMKKSTMEGFVTIVRIATMDASFVITSKMDGFDELNAELRENAPRAQHDGKLPLWRRLLWLAW